MMAAIYADNIFRRGITSAVIAGSGATMQTTDRDLSKARRHNCSIFSHYRMNYSNRRKTINRVSSTSNTLAEDSARAVGSERSTREAEEILVFISQNYHHSDADCRAQHKKDDDKC